MAFPREGPAARSVADALRYSVLINVKGHVDTMNMKFAKSEGVGSYS
jgi:hypothetical protein